MRRRPPACSERTAYNWLARYRAGGAAALADRSSAPGHCPHATPAGQVAAIERLRRQRLSGPQIAAASACRAPPSAPCCAGSASAACGPRAEAAGRPLRARAAGRADPHRHQEARPHRRRRPSHHRRPHAADSNRGIGWEPLHVAIDDASRLAYTEILPDEKKESACAFLAGALRLLRRHGVSVERVMTDNGSAYRSHDFRQALPQRRPPPHPHPALHAAHQRQGRALHPDRPARMGLCPDVPILRSEDRRSRSLDR